MPHMWTVDVVLVRVSTVSASVDNQSRVPQRRPRREEVVNYVLLLQAYHLCLVLMQNESRDVANRITFLSPDLQLEPKNSVCFPRRPAPNVYHACCVYRTPPEPHRDRRRLLRL